MLVAGYCEFDFTYLIGRASAVFEQDYFGPEDFVAVVGEFADLLLDMVFQLIAGFKVDTLDVDIHMIRFKC